MTKSMTGFGLAVSNFADASITVEIRSLNSKFFDLNLRLPKKYSDKEILIRSLLADTLERGKVTFSLDIQYGVKSGLSGRYNHDMFTSYYSELKLMADKVGAGHDQLFQIALNSPDVIQNQVKEELDPAEWEKIYLLILEAINNCNQFRIAEGNSLNEKLVGYMHNIMHGLVLVESLDAGRIDKIRSRIKGSIVDFFGHEGYDINRLEQEIIFYIEKLDIHEERVRLKTHLDYFLDILKDHQSNGKKLGFIAQEIGREINTIGSKANDAEIQKHVVTMKEELEKIKEQLNNIL